MQNELTYALQLFPVDIRDAGVHHLRSVWKCHRAGNVGNFVQHGPKGLQDLTTGHPCSWHERAGESREAVLFVTMDVKQSDEIHNFELCGYRETFAGFNPCAEVHAVLTINVV